MPITSYYREAAYANALQFLAQGEEYEETYETVGYCYRSLEESDLRLILAEALRDALAQGVEREDIDGSWFS